MRHVSTMLMLLATTTTLLLLLLLTTTRVFVVAVAAVPPLPPHGKALQFRGMNMPADSAMGIKLLSQARRYLEDANDANDDEEDANNGDANEQEAAADAEQNEEEQDWQLDMTWVAGYSIKYQGCHYVQQFSGQQRQNGEEQNNDAAVANSGGGVQMQDLVRFRLCPSRNCNAKNSQGCNNKYGDYIIDLDTFVNAYYEYQQRLEEYECEWYLQNSCDCNNDDNDDENNGDDFNLEQCEYDCFVAAKMEDKCVDGNPYNEDGEEGEQYFDVERYMECAEWEMNDDQGDNNGRRQLEDADQGSGLYIGPYCSQQGGAIYLGGFLDETCTQFSDKNNGAATFEALTGMELPYASTNIIRTDSCVSCQNFDNGEDDGQNNGEQNNEVVELCQDVYYSAGKCEERLPSGTVYEKNNNACAYIGSIQTVSQDGIAKVKNGHASTTSFIAFLILTTMGLGFYVFYLRRRLAIHRESLKSVLLEHPHQQQTQKPTEAEHRQYTN